MHFGLVANMGHNEIGIVESSVVVMVGIVGGIAN